MFQKFVMVTIVIGLLLVPGYVGAIAPNQHDVYEFPNGSTSCQGCEITFYGGGLIVTYKCGVSVGSGVSGCYVIGAGCGFSNNYCVDVWGQLADGIQRDREDEYVEDSANLFARRF